MRPTTQSAARRTSSKRAGSGLTLGIAMNSASSLIVASVTAAKGSSLGAMRRVAALVLLALVVAGPAAAIETFPITGASIAKGKLGCTGFHYKAALGTPRRLDMLARALGR